MEQKDIVLNIHLKRCYLTSMTMALMMIIAQSQCTDSDSSCNSADKAAGLVCHVIKHGYG